MQVSVLLRAPMDERRGALDGRGLGAVKEKEEVRFRGGNVSKAEVGRKTETDIDREDASISSLLAGEGLEGETKAQMEKLLIFVAQNKSLTRPGNK